MSVNKLFHLLNETNSSCPDFKGQNYKASFHTRSSAKGPRKKTYRAHLEGEGPRKGEHAVVKVFRHAPGTEAMCDVEITKNVLARKFARKFNKMITEPRDKITFTLPLKSTVDKFGMGTYFFHHSRHLDKQEWVLMEENLVYDNDCKFEVFLRKNGDRPLKDLSSLDVFCHFTYNESGQKFVLCGFQGIHTEENGYKLSTPCFQSTDRRWGITDKGQAGMASVFSKHKCTNLCYSWPKPTDHLSVDGHTGHISSESEADEGGSSCDEDSVAEEAARVGSSLAFSAKAESEPCSRNNTVLSIEEEEEKKKKVVEEGGEEVKEEDGPDCDDDVAAEEAKEVARVDSSMAFSAKGESEPNSRNNTVLHIEKEEEEEKEGKAKKAEKEEKEKTRVGEGGSGGEATEKEGKESG